MDCGILNNLISSHYNKLDGWCIKTMDFKEILTTFEMNQVGNFRVCVVMVHFQTALWNCGSDVINVTYF
jgi:hypothetical protein